MRFTAGASGQAKVEVTGKGARLGPPTTDSLQSDIVMQLLVDDGITIECFKTSFPGPSGSGQMQTTATQLKAKGP